MKMLVIGMDGAQRSTFARGWTPFIESLIQKGESLKLKEDLISRGWAEIFTGKHGIETGALYDRPLLNGSYKWSLKFNMLDIPGFGSIIKPIWQKLNENGYKVGIMNLPTTFPAPVVDGFFVSGGGGGSDVINDPTEDICYPKKICASLLENGYIVDERLGSLLEKKLYNPKKMFARLEQKNLRRTECYIMLARKFNIDFGFLAYKSSSVMAELYLVPEWRKFLEKKEIDQELLEAIAHYYKIFDRQVKSLVNAFPETEVILVSDHGMAETRYLLNINKFLQKHGFQEAIETSYSPKQFLVNSLKALLPYHIKYALKRKINIPAIHEDLIKFDPQQTIAFCITGWDWVKGIYINDIERFNGPVRTDSIRYYEKKICSHFNKHPLAKKFNLRCVIKSADSSLATKYFPNLILDIPEGFRVTNDSSKFLSEVECPCIPTTKSNWSSLRTSFCQKAPFPVAVNSKGWLVKPTEDKHDLRLVYDHIINSFS